MYKDQIAKLQETISDLRARAAKSQDSAHEKLNPLFRKDDRKPPEDFEDSSFLYMRSCDADQGFRPVPCPAFWLSPDLEVVPLSNLGTPTRTLTAGDSYRLTATVRNRGDLAVPAAKVEFWLVTPSLGFDTRFATRLGVAQDRVQAHGSTRIALDYQVPPGMNGHFCLFARVFSFAPLDIPVSDTALDPRIDRHVCQLNLNFVAPAETMMMDWVHPRNARETLMLLPMPPAQHRVLRHELLTPLRLLPGRLAAEVVRQIKIEVAPADDKGVKVQLEPTKEGLMLISRDGDAVSIERRLELTKMVMAIVGGDGRMHPAEQRKLMAEYRAMTTQTVRSRVQLTLPEIGLKPSQAVALQVQRRDDASGEIAGGVAMYLMR